MSDQFDIENLGRGDHMPASDFEAIPDGMVGSADYCPFIKATPDWDENGIPYGAWCWCAECGRRGRSTIAFDFYKRDDGYLDCEVCMQMKLRK